MILAESLLCIASVVLLTACALYLAAAKKTLDAASRLTLLPRDSALQVEDEPPRRASVHEVSVLENPDVDIEAAARKARDFDGLLGGPLP